jgi:hypothetical protein
LALESLETHPERSSAAAAMARTIFMIDIVVYPYRSH